MRRSCLECVLKHLGDAAVYIEECAMGYPDYFGFVYGHLDHASSECLSEFPDLAMTIREHRIKWANTRRDDKPHKIPFEAIFGYIDTMEEAGREVEIPPEVYAGLTLGEDGKPVFSMDTRPPMDWEDMLKPVFEHAPGSVIVQNKEASSLVEDRVEHPITANPFKS